MKPIIYNGNNELIVAYKNDFIKSVLDKYSVRLKKNLSGSGIRSLWYHEKENTLLVTHLYGSRVHLINLTTGKMRYHNFHSKTVRHVYVHNNEIISASWDGTIRVVDFYTLKQRLVLTDAGMGRSPQSATARIGNKDYVFGVSYDSDLNPLCRSNSVRKWDLKDGTVEGVITQTGEHLSTLSSAECVVYNGYLYTISDSGYLTVFDAESGEWLKESFIPRCLRSLIVVKEHNCLLVTDQDGYIHRYDLELMEFTYYLQCHLSDVTSIVQFPLQPDIVASSSFDGSVKIMSLPYLEELSAITTKNSLWSCILKKNILLAGGYEDEILIYDASDPKNCILLGKMCVFDDSYAVCPENSRQFFTDCIDNFEVISLETAEPITGKNSEYLLNTSNSQTILYDMFGLPDESFNLIGQSKNFFAQLPGSSRENLQNL
ncbi:MAG: PQQ-binding-like beta-propeller repeat protein [Bacteroidales bacterium]|nr:PQQ-binding-like beta-propeller repeat protein [Bacteroidales bacterium]